MILAVAVALGLQFVPGTANRERRAASASNGGIDPAYADYLGDASCRDCHPGEYAAHTSSGHSKTLRPAARVALRRHWDGRTAEDPERPGVVWTYRVADGRLSVERARADSASGPARPAEPRPSGSGGAGGDASSTARSRSWLGEDTGSAPDRAGAEVERFVVDYAFGSGRHATTLVSMLDRNPRHPIIREHRLTFFAHAAAPGLTPGQSLGGHASGNTPTGRVHSTDQALTVLRLPRDGDLGPRPGGARPGDDDPQRDVRALPRAGAAHVAAARRAPARATCACPSAWRGRRPPTRFASAGPATGRPRW